MKQNIPIMSKRNKIITNLVPIIISFGCAFYYKFYTPNTLKPFILTGLISILINLLISLIFALVMNEKLGEPKENNLVLTTMILTLILPYSSFYVLSVIIIMGFKFPFIF